MYFTGAQITGCVSCEATQGRAILRLRGELTAASSEQLLPAARQAAVFGNVDVEWREVERIEASALEILIALDRDVRRNGGTVAHTCQAPAIRQYLTIAGLDTVLRADDGVADA